MSLPKSMKALRYSEPRKHSVVQVPLPVVRDGDVLIKVGACGVCGTDLHIHDGEFIAKVPSPPTGRRAELIDQFPLIPGHETVGKVAAIGKDVKGFKVGDRVCADNSELCGHCFYCRRGEALLCEDFQAHGVTMNGGFAEYCAYPQGKVFHVNNLNDIDATLLEPASCAAHGLEKIAPKLGSSVLMIGAGPTGLVLAQLLKLNGGCHVTLAANAGIKMELAQKLEAADEYIFLDRKTPEKQWEQIKTDNPYGFDIVVEATGSARILEDAIDYVRRGGKLVVYGVYSNAARVSWPPSKIFGDEITIIGSFSETFQFPNALAYLDSGKVKVEGIVNKTFTIDQWDECLEAMRNKSAIKAAIVW